ncbi:MAG TPA: hypothetical protein DHW71_00105 [Gammaproteobacteria bacterium]|nr:hypothetical protein [Gammaproteobacteria bacterium]
MRGVLRFSPGLDVLAFLGPRPEPLNSESCRSDFALKGLLPFDADDLEAGFASVATPSRSSLRFLGRCFFGG